MSLSAFAEPYTIMDERSPRAVAARCTWPAPAYPDVIGYKTLQFSWGGLLTAVVPTEPPWCATHLVRNTHEGTPGPTLCGLDRFSHAASPGWSVAGGLSGPRVPVMACSDCAVARDASLPVYGLNAEVFA